MTTGPLGRWSFRVRAPARIRVVPLVFDCEIQTRFRDVNLGGHVDNVEAIRIIDEARILFFRFAELGATQTG